MYSFLLLAIPAGLLWYIFSDKKRKAVFSIIPIIAGIFTGTAYTFILKFVVTLNENVTDSAFSYINTINLRYNLLPVFIISTVFFFLSKDSIEYKVKSFIPLSLSFQEICTAYFVIGNQEKGSFFLLICLPALVCSTYLASGFLLEKAVNIFEKTSKAIIKSSALVLTSIILIALIPAVQSLWFFNKADFIYILSSIILFALTVAVTAFLYKKNTESSEEI